MDKPITLWCILKFLILGPIYFGIAVFALVLVAACLGSIPDWCVLAIPAVLIFYGIAIQKPEKIKT